MKFPAHKGVDGSFQELARHDDVEFGQLSILTVNPTCRRGGHYHERKIEWFCCVMGSGILEVTDIKNGSKKSHILNGFSNRMFIEVLPGFAHTVINRDPYADLEVLIIISEKFDSEDPDTKIFKEE